MAVWRGVLWSAARLAHPRQLWAYGSEGRPGLGWVYHDSSYPGASHAAQCTGTATRVARPLPRHRRPARPRHRLLPPRPQAHRARLRPGPRLRLAARPQAALDDFAEAAE